MKYVSITEASPEEVLRRAKEFYAKHTRLDLVDEAPDAVTFKGAIGTAKIEVDREHGRTNVHASTDRVVGLDVTDITKRFLYTLERS